MTDHDMIDYTSIIRPLYNETQERSHDGLPVDELGTARTAWDGHTDGYDNFTATAVEELDSDLREQLDQYSEAVQEYSQIIQDIRDIKRDEDIKEQLPEYMRSSTPGKVSLADSYGMKRLDEWINDNRGVIISAADEDGRVLPGGLQDTAEGYLYEALYLQGEYPGAEVDDMYENWEEQADEGGEWAAALWNVLDRHDVPAKLTRMRELDRTVQDEAEQINEHLETLIAESVTEQQEQSLMDRFRSII